MTKTRCTVQVDCGEPVRRAREAIGHAEYHRLLQPQHVRELRELRDRFHDRQLGGAGITEQMGDPLIDQEPQKRVTAGRAFVQMHLNAS